MKNMETIALPRTEYEILKKKASLYEEIFRFLPKKTVGIEFYSEDRVEEFMREDRLDKTTKDRLEKLFKTL